MRRNGTIFTDNDGDTTKTFTKGRLYTVKLRGKLQANGLVSLYLDYYFGTSKDADGHIKSNRKVEYLNIHLINEPRTPQEKQINKEQLELAMNIRARRESYLKHTGEGLPDPKIRKINFLDYYQRFLDEYPNKDVRLVKYSLKYFKDFIQTDYLSPSEVTPSLVQGYKRYLMDNLNGETPYNYFTKFKKLCKQATRERVFFENPAEDITISRPQGVKKDILSLQEIEKLARVEISNRFTKLAFLFCLNTGLRFVDVKDLRWKNINLENNLLTKKQTKTRNSSAAYVYIDLNKNALKILNQLQKGKPGDPVFNLPSWEASAKMLKDWAHKAGVNKNVTWHTARHSFATNLLLQKADIKTVSGLLGHADLKHTVKYLHLVSEIRRQAVDSLPEIDI